MNKCNHCGTENQPNYFFCYNCGKQLLFACVACQKWHLPDLQFCPNSGKNIPQAKVEDKARKEAKEIANQIHGLFTEIGFSLRELEYLVSA